MLRGSHPMPVLRHAWNWLPKVDLYVRYVGLSSTGKQKYISFGFTPLCPIVGEVNEVVASAAHSRKHGIVLAFKYFARVSPVMDDVANSTTRLANMLISFEYPLLYSTPSSGT